MRRALFTILLLFVGAPSNAEGIPPRMGATKLTVSGTDEVRIPLTRCLSRELRASEFVTVVEGDYKWWIDVVAASGFGNTVNISTTVNYLVPIHQIIDLANKYTTPHVLPEFISAVKSSLPATAVSNLSHELKTIPANQIEQFCRTTIAEFHVTHIEPSIRAYQQYQNRQ